MGASRLDLHFVNDVLIGCRKTMNKSCWIGWKARRWNPAPLRSGRQRKGALEVILNNDSWETDEDYLKLVLADYTEQVLEYQSEHPGY